MESMTSLLPSKPGLAYLRGLPSAARDGRSPYSTLRLKSQSSSQKRQLFGTQLCSSRRTLDACYPKATSSSQAELTKDAEVAPSGTAISVDGEAVDERIESLVRDIKENLRAMNDGETSPSAYDTAWVARIPSADDPTKPHFPVTLQWILNNQMDDGSWGEPSYFLLYDRLVNTLACVLTLKIWNTGAEQMEKGLEFLRSHAPKLNKITGTITCGFEVAFPSMLNEARSLGLDLPYELQCLTLLVQMREKKIKRIPLEVMHSVYTTLLYSLEALQEVVQWDKILNLQSADGSFLSSPAATAAVYMKTGDKKSLDFLTYIVNRFGDNAPCQYPIDLLERIWAVDTIQRLGIDHHFRKEISDILDYVYRNAGAKGISWGRDNPVPDVDDTCMALRLMRLHGYPTSSDVLEYFRDDDGLLLCFPGETHRGVSDMYNLYRFSQIAFPGEKILKEAQDFVQNYLQNCVDTNQLEDKWSLKQALGEEVKYALKYPWRVSFERIEAREYLDQYGESDVWIAKTIYWMYNVNNPKYMELAKLDYNRMQAMYKEEMDSVEKWWAECGSDYPLVTEVIPKEGHILIAATLYEPEYSASRIAYTKCNLIEHIIMELFQTHPSVDDLRLLCQAVELWNPALTQTLPLKVRVAFIAMCYTLNDMAAQSSKAQGRDMFPYLHDIRVKQIQAYLKNREMRDGASFTSLADYIENSKEDNGLAPRLLPAMFLMGERLQDFAIEWLGPRSRIHDQLSTFLRIFVDIEAYKSSPNKDAPNAVSICMKEKNCTEQEALDHLMVMKENAFDELVHESLKPGRVPRACRRLMLEQAKITEFFFSDHIEPTMTRHERINAVMERVLTPV